MWVRGGIIIIISYGVYVDEKRGFILGRLELMNWKDRIRWLRMGYLIMGL